ncbi:MAG: NAD(P)-binding domain-containing protein, partial [Clostridia bacterium]
MPRVAVLGAGAWGTAIAGVLASRLEVSLWARDFAQAQAMAQTRRNERYLPGVEIPNAVLVTARLEEALARRELVLAATPVAALREVLQALPPSTPLVWLCKGFEESSGALP